MEYKFIKNISEGSFGSVDLVEGEEGTRFARKTLLPQKRRDYVHRRIVKRFHDEVSFMENVKHQCITPIIYSELECKSPWFVMPLANSSLRRELKNLSNKDKWPIKALFDILSGLKHIHKSGYYHRDVCCANILIFSSESGPRYKLSDFGTITKIGSTGPFFKIDSGHYRYAPPEITVKQMIGSARSDIYGFGAMLHEIYGENPRIAKKCITDETGPLGEIMMKCTREDPQDRYPDIQSLYDNLSKVLTS